MSLPLLFGPYGSQSLQHAAHLKEYGANTVWFHGFDEQAFAACARHDLFACVEFKTFRANFDQHPELIPIGIDGQPIRYGRLVQGVCLSRSEFVDQIEAELLAGLQAYRPTGIWLDYLTYAGWFETPEPDLQESCFCSRCITDFLDATGIDADTPEQILANHQPDWTQRKCERIAQYTHHYAKLIRQHHPDCIVGAYMCPWQPQEYDHALTRIFAQDYAQMAPAIDIFTPLIYAQKSGRSSSWGHEFLTHARKFIPQDRKTQLILDALDFPDSLLAIAEAPVPSWGVQLFGGGKVFQSQEDAHIFLHATERIRAAIAIEDSSL